MQNVVITSLLQHDTSLFLLHKLCHEKVMLLLNKILFCHMHECHTCPLLWRLCENECELFFFSPRTEREKLRFSALFSSAKQKGKHRRNSSATQYSSLSVFAALLQFFFI